MSRNWTFFDNCNLYQTEEQIEEATPRLNALALEWSNIYLAREEENLRRQLAFEDGDDRYDGTECSECDGDGYIYNTDNIEDKDDDTSTQKCEVCNGTGRDLRIIKERENERENRNLRLEIIEEMLARLGARMMRAYEHHNEDERYVEYMENQDYGY